jgi:hypothetical protein
MDIYQATSGEICSAKLPLKSGLTISYMIGHNLLYESGLKEA